jgi:hypothetical protein
MYAALTLSGARLWLKLGHIPDQSILDMWWTKWHWDRFSLSTSVLPCLYYSATHLYSFVHLLPTLYSLGNWQHYLSGRWMSIKCYQVSKDKRFQRIGDTGVHVGVDVCVLL